MNKSTIFLAAFGLCLSSAASASDAGFKSGFRIGVGVGYEKYQVTQRASFSEAPGGLGLAPESLSKRKQKSDSSFSIHGGYDHFLGGIYSSLELDYRYSPNKNKLTLKPNNILYAEGPIQYTQTHKHDIGVSGHVGYKITSAFIGYGIVNIRWGHFEEIVKPTNSADPINNGKRKETKVGFGGGIGAKYLLPQNWSVAAEATFNTYAKSIKIPQNLHRTVDTRFFASSSKPKITNIILKVSKTF